MDTIHPVNMSHPGQPLTVADPPIVDDRAPEEMGVAAAEALREAELRAAEEQSEHEEFSIDQLRTMAAHLGICNAATIVDRPTLVRQIKGALS